MTGLLFQITTERLLLRPPTIDDAEILRSLMADPDITVFLAWKPHKDIDTTINLINSLQKSQESDKGYHWVIIYGSTIIGIVSLVDVRRHHRTWEINRAELSYWISPKYQCHGYATEASRTIIDFGFSKLNLHKIVVAHSEENISSRKVVERLNFKKYGVERDAFRKNGTWHTLVWYDLIHYEA